MNRLTLIAVGKLKESWWAEAQAEYTKRIRPLAKLDNIEVAAAPITATVSPEASMREEGARILARIPNNSDIVVFDRIGKKISSITLAETLREAEAEGRHITYIIGGAAGLDESVLKKARHTLSMSDLTFTHEMARVILLEQLYRAACIKEGRKYHY